MSIKIPFAYEDREGDTWYITKNSHYIAFKESIDDSDQWFTYFEINELYGPLTPLYEETEKVESVLASVETPLPRIRRFSVTKYNENDKTVDAEHASVGVAGALEFYVGSTLIGAFSASEWDEFWEESWEE